MSEKMNNIIDFLVEIPNGSYVKYEFDKKENMLRCDRILHTSMAYPGNYGYIPKTLARDGDPIDVLMISDCKIYPMTLVQVKIIGVLKMKDEKGYDEKILVAPDSTIDPYYEDMNDINDVPKHLLSKIKHFFEHYKDTEPNKWVKIEGFGDKIEAVKLYENSKKAYCHNLTRSMYKAMQNPPDMCGNN
jgi:inorganic pyrophosphatase